MNSRRSKWLLAVVLLAVMAGGFSRLRFDTDVLGLLPPELSVVRGLKLQQAHFAGARELLLTVSAPDPDTAEAAARTLVRSLESHPSLVRRVVWRPPWQDDPGSAAEFLAWSWLQQPPDDVRRLVESLRPSTAAATLRDTREQLAVSVSPGDLARLAYDPLGLGTLPGGGGPAGFDDSQRLFVSDDGTFRLLMVEPAAPLANYKAEAAWLENIRGVVTTLISSGDIPDTVRLGFTGGPVFAAEAASGMERDMTRSAAGTLAVIALLFWAAHRRFRPLLVLVATLGVAVVATFAAGALVLGRLNLISLGFAAILLGLIVDYGLLAYQERRASPDEPIDALRRRVRPGILWSALTTAGAFLLLNLGGLPGLAQLGTLVAIGVVLGVFLMLRMFLPFSGPVPEKTPLAANVPEPRDTGGFLLRTLPAAGWTLTALIAGGLALLVVHGPPAVEHSSESLRPRDSLAYAELDQIRQRLDRPEDPFLLITQGRTEQEVADLLASARPILEDAVLSGELESFTLAGSWWPNPSVWTTNTALLSDIVRDWPLLRSNVLAAGFTESSLALGDGIARHWAGRLHLTAQAWPTGRVSEWVFHQAAARDTDGYFALGLLQPAAAATNGFGGWTGEMDGSVVTGWGLLGDEVLDLVGTRLRWLLAGIVLVLIVCLRLALGSWREAFLSLAALASGLVLLLTVMRLAGWSWNLLNLMAVPLLIGAGVDYTLHVRLALRRHAGDLRALWRTTGRALLLCAATTATGFGSLAWAGDAGLASLGRVCAAGVLCVLAASVLALPLWWRRGPFPERGVALAAPVDRPAGVYRAGLWRLALGIVRRVPLPLCQGLCLVGVRLYRLFRPERVAVVTENLRPVVGETSAPARARRLFDQFALKLCDLWRYEAGLPTDALFGELTGWEHFEEARRSGAGVLLVTAHLGNWEFGAPLLARRGVRLLVLTQPEPGEGFTELRRDARARWGIETLVVGEDPFAFVEIIKRLQDGQAVALLVDRPPPASAVTVELFGRPFAASVAAAELARASGCRIVPAWLPRVDDTYAAHLLPAVAYDRAALGRRAARVALTGEILRAFEPAIRQHPDQWFHFVPLWQPRV